MSFLLAILAMIGLGSGSGAVRPAAAMAGMAMTRSADATAMVGMDCHHDQKRSVPPCGQACPWASLCAANVIVGVEPGIAHAAATPYVYAYADDALHAIMSRPPPARPPRS